MTTTSKRQSLCARWENWNIDCPLSIIVAVFCTFMMGAFMCAMVGMVVKLSIKEVLSGGW